MRTHTGVAERMFAALAEAGVNMKMITTGDIKISVLVDRADGVKALQAVHRGGGRDLADLTRRLSSMEDIVVSDVLLDMEQGRITIYNLPDRAGNCSRVF